jgi:hypothetical protein
MTAMFPGLTEVIPPDGWDSAKSGLGEQHRTLNHVVESSIMNLRDPGQDAKMIRPSMPDPGVGAAIVARNRGNSRGAKGGSLSGRPEQR